MKVAKFGLWMSMALLLFACKEDESRCDKDTDCPLGQRCVVRECRPNITPAGDVDTNNVGADGGEVGVDVPSCGGVPPVTELRINEVLADPPSGFDSNCDGNANTTQDEFVEIVNNSDKTLDLQGVQLQEGGETKATINACLPPFGALVVFSGGSAACTDLGTTVSMVGSKSLGLVNGGGTVSLVTSTGEQLDTVNYPSISDASFVRDPDFTGETFQAHKDVSTLPASPGKCTDGSALAPGCGEVVVADGDDVADVSDTGGDTHPGDTTGVDTTGTDTNVGQDTNPADVAPACDPPTIADLVLTEILYDPVNSFTGARDQTDGDANCDCDFNGGTECVISNTTSSNEFIEFVNVSNVAVNLDGVELLVNGSAEHTFAGETCLEPGQAILLFNKDPDTTACTELADDLIVVESFSLVNGGGTAMIAHPTIAPASGGGFTLGSVTWPSTNMDASYQRVPDLTGDNSSFQAFDAVITTGTLQSPGTCADPSLTFANGCQ